MKFKVDENSPLELAELLRAADYDAETVFSEGLQGKRDTVVVEVCQREGRILITLDLDFADIYTYPPHLFPGFIVLRPHWQDKQHVIDLFQRAIPLMAHEPVEQRLWIVEESRVRIRSSETP